MNKLVAMFPGQGSQYVGMATKLYEENVEVQELFKEASKVLGYDLYHLCLCGPEMELQKTENTQPAILATSVAAFRVYLKDGGRLPDFGAGHSLGEITALCCGGVIPFADAIRIVRLRGKLMQEAVPEGLGAMAAVRGVSADVILEVCESISIKDHIVVVSNYNAPDQTVISGNSMAVEEAGNLLRKEGGTVIPLKVSAPFHSPLMEKCANELRAVLAQVEFGDFSFPVISNVTGKPYIDKSKVAEYLYEQITKPVLWCDSMKYLHIQGVDVAIEFGPRSVLKDLATKNVPSMKALCFDNDKVTIQRVMLSLGKENSHVQVNVLAKCLAAAVSTKNNEWDEEAYQQGVVQPYMELAKLAMQVKESGMVDDKEVEKAFEYLRKILMTKQVPQEEQKIILDELQSAV